MLQARFDLVDLLDCVQIYRIDREPIKCIGRHCHNIALTKAAYDVLDALLLWFIGMDAQNFRGQMIYLGCQISIGPPGRLPDPRR